MSLWTLFKSSVLSAFLWYCSVAGSRGLTSYLEGEEVHLLYLVCIDLGGIFINLCVCRINLIPQGHGLFIPFGDEYPNPYMFISDFTLACMVGTLLHLAEGKIVGSPFGLVWCGSVYNLYFSVIFVWIRTVIVYIF